jgi:septum formation protein
MMTDTKYDPTPTSEHDAPPPDYDTVAAQHGEAPKRPIPPAGAKPLARGPFPLDIPILQQLKGKRIILASASPRRKQLLNQVHI